MVNTNSTRFLEYLDLKLFHAVLMTQRKYTKLASYQVYEGIIPLL